MKHFIKLLTSNTFMLCLAIFFASIVVIHSLYAKNFIWLSRSGSLLVSIGIVLISRTFIIKKDLLLNIGDKNMNMNSPEYFEAEKQQIPDYIKTNEESKKAIGIFGPLISVFGTVIWGYGELLYTFFNN